jgi:SAM-dependent methyltransferase
MSRYGIRFPYFARRAEIHYDTTEKTDEWQLEVYLKAAGIMKERNLRSVLDLGCGSGYKLIRFMGGYEFTGIEVPRTVQWLKEHHPDGRWLVSDLSSGMDGAFDLLICADVIEHLLNPDRLLDFIDRVRVDWIVLSTPDRSLLYGRRQQGWWGPPHNPGHVREWSFSEFGRYIGTRFRILEHVISNRVQATQMIVCRKQA